MNNVNQAIPEEDKSVSSNNSKLTPMKKKDPTISLSSGDSVVDQDHLMS